MGFHNTLTLDLPLGTHLLQAAVYVNGFKELAIWSKVYSLSIRRVHYSAADLAVCCSVLQCVGVWCSVLQCCVVWNQVYPLPIRRVHYPAADLAVCCSVLQRVAVLQCCVVCNQVYSPSIRRVHYSEADLAVCCGVLQRVAVFLIVTRSILSFLLSGALLYSRSRGVLQCAVVSVAVCCSVLQCFLLWNEMNSLFHS